MTAAPVIDLVWSQAGSVWVSPLPSAETIAAGGVLESVLGDMVRGSWGSLAGRGLGSLAGAWGVNTGELQPVLDLFSGSAWEDPTTWIGAAQVGASLILTGLGVSAAVTSAIPVVGQFALAVVAAVLGVVGAVSGDEELGRPREESAPPRYSREIDEDLARQFLAVIRSDDHDAAWSGFPATLDCYHPAGYGDGCEWGVGVSSGDATMMPGSGYWPGSFVRELVIGAQAFSIGSVRPSARVVAELLSASYLGDSGAVWSVNASALSALWLSVALHSERSFPLTPRAPGSDFWPVGDDDASCLVRVDGELAELVRSMVPAGLPPDAASWPLYRDVGHSGVSRLFPVPRASRDEPGPVLATRPLLAAATCEIWRKHQVSRRQSATAAFGVAGQPGYQREFAVAAAPMLDEYQRGRVRDKSLIGLGFASNPQSSASASRRRRLLPAPP